MIKVRCAIFLALSFAVHCIPATARAEDMPPEFDPDLPQPFDASSVLSVLQNPPFNRRVDYADSLLLTGVAYLEGKPMATLLDKNTKKRYVVSEEPNEQGWRLAEASVSNELHGTEIKLQVGEEVVTIRYSESQLNPPRKNPRAAALPDQPAARAAASPAVIVKGLDRKGMSKEAREKFEKSMSTKQDKLAKMTDEQRAAYSQKILNKIKSQDQTATKKAKL